MKKNVLEVKIVKMNDEYSCLVITKQNDEVIKRGDFKFEASNNFEIISSALPQYVALSYGGILYIRGIKINEDYTCLIIPSEEIPKIEEAIKELNEKYGKPKRWRAMKGERYYYLSADEDIKSKEDNRYLFDHDKYEFGNYFKTREQAIRAIPKIKKCFNDYHEEIGE